MTITELLKTLNDETSDLMYCVRLRGRAIALAREYGWNPDTNEDHDDLDSIDYLRSILHQLCPGGDPPEAG